MVPFGYVHIVHYVHSVHLVHPPRYAPLSPPNEFRSPLCVILGNANRNPDL